MIEVSLCSSTKIFLSRELLSSMYCDSVIRDVLILHVFYPPRLCSPLHPAGKKRKHMKRVYLFSKRFALKVTHITSSTIPLHFD